MARISNEVKEIAEKNRKTMTDCPMFELWVHKYLRNRDRLEDYRKAFNYINKGGSDDKEDSGLGCSIED